jgi:hypothetical protein
MAKVSEFLPPSGPEPRTPEFLPYHPVASNLFDPMRRCGVRGCSNATEFLVNDGTSRLWQPRCAQHKLFGVTAPKVKLPDGSPGQI